jgi:hypothetical protein
MERRSPKQMDLTKSVHGKGTTAFAGHLQRWADVSTPLGNRKGILLVLVVWLGTVPAYAHRPYEYVDAPLTDASGRRLYLVKAFTDGIMLPDPTRVIIRDGTGNQLAETPMRDDMAIVCRTKRECLVFGYDSSSFGAFPSDVWKVTGPSLSPVQMSTRWRFVGFGLHMSRHWLGYSTALGAVFLPLVTFLWTRHLRRGSTRTALLVGIAIGGVGWLCVVSFALLMSDLSVVVLSLLAAPPAGALWMWRPRWLGCAPAVG